MLTVDDMKQGEVPISQVICGDCLEGMKKLPDACVDLVVTDPPYGVGIEYGNEGKDTFEQWIKLTQLWLPEALRISATVLFTPGGFEQEKWLFVNLMPKWRICWYKGATSQRSPIGFKHWETVFVYGDIKHQSPDYFFALPERTDSIKHPVPKSLRFCKWLIDKFSKKNDLVLDPFLGSGTTAVACKQLGRNFIGFEINPDYCKIAEDRLRQEILL